MILWISLAVLCIAIVAPIVWPLLRSTSASGLSDQDSRLAVQRDRLREIDSEEAAGRLSASEAEQARSDLVDTVAAELQMAEKPGIATGRSPQQRLVAIAIAALVPLAAIGVYRVVGAPDIEMLLAAQPSNQPMTEEDVRGVMNDLVKRTQTNPEDGQAWLMLGQAFRALDDPAQSAVAFGRAAALLPPDARLLADQAEMLALSRGRDFGSEPRELLQKALAINADDAKANALMAAVELQAGNRPAAVPYLRIVLSGMEPGSEQAGQIAELIANIDQVPVAPGTAGTAAAPNMAASPGTPTGPAAAASPAPQRVIAGEIAIAEGAPAFGEVLFISARSADGPRMPFAAVRIENPSLPHAFSLSDADAMSPQRLLSTAGAVIVEARLSRSGNAMRQSGDRFGQSTVIASGNAPQDIRIVIDQTVP